MIKNFLKMNPKLIIPFLIVILFILFIAYHLSPNSRLIYDVEVLNLTPPIPEYSPGTSVSVGFALKALEFDKNPLKPIVKNQLVVSTQLANSSASIRINGKNYKPIDKKIRDEYDPTAYTFYFELPIEVTEANVTLSGVVPKAHNKNLFFVHIVQRMFYPIGRQDWWLGDNYKIIK